MRVMLVGDTHGNLGWVKQTVIPTAKAESVDLIIQVGDWGFWWPGDDKDQRLNTLLANADIPMWFIDGNHDNHPRLRAIPEENDGYIGSHLRYLKRGTRFELDGVKFLALGGAYSIDKQWRTEGKSWWREEEITYTEALAAAEGGKATVMLTHDKPYGLHLSWDRKDIEACWANQKLIRAVVDEVKPKWLFHGHLHWRESNMLALAGGHMVRVESLNCDEEAGAWVIRDTNTFKSITTDWAATAVVRS